MTERYRDYDRVVVGAGMFGLSAARLLLARGLRVAVVDVEPAPLMRASLVNQARVHNGYHYPRSVYTALRSASYYTRFVRDFPEAVNARFTKVYGIASSLSVTQPEHFETFCSTVGIPARPVDPGRWLRPGSVSAAYETEEFGFDAPQLRRLLLERIHAAPGRCDLHLGRGIRAVSAESDHWVLELTDGDVLRAAGVVNASYAGTNAVLDAFGLAGLPLAYELCEVALVDSPPHRDVGITIMDGPFFSLMPFGHSGLHSLTAVDYTPRARSTARLPEFPCQRASTTCRPSALGNCGLCPERPSTAYPQIRALAAGFLAEVEELRFVEALHSVKVVLACADVDDARPTLAKVERSTPLFVTLFGGKINTVYDLEEVL